MQKNVHSTHKCICMEFFLWSIEKYYAGEIMLLMKIICMCNVRNVSLKMHVRFYKRFYVFFFSFRKGHKLSG